jgi:DNA-binding transcriptional LysR family regulator
MNIHHLELFFHVARHGGIMEAVRNMPYGIQQPAVSGQILQLEADLGVKLFQRRPFELTPAGAELFEFIRPFFSSVEQVGERIRGGEAQTLRLAAPVMALRDHLPEVLGRLRKRFPKLKFTLRAARHSQVESALLRHELDFAITVLEGRAAQELKTAPLVSLPVVLLVARKSPFKSASEILTALGAGLLREPLISLLPNEPVVRRFQEFLAAKGLAWPADIEVTDLELIGVYVARGFGVGLSIGGPGLTEPKGTRALPIEGVEPLQLGAIWQGRLTPTMEVLLAELRSEAAAVAGRSGL